MLFVVLAPVAPVGKSQTYEAAFAIAGTVYVTEFSHWHTVDVPEIVPAASGNGFTVIARLAIEPSPQAFVPFTVMFPEAAELL